MILFRRFLPHLWSMAFRPFFLASAIHAVASILLWILILLFGFTSPFSVGGVQIHSYEMVFGFARATIIGFLFTAGQYWTKTVLIKEKQLFFMFLLWLVGRVGFLSFGYIGTVAIVLDMFCDLMVLYHLIPALFKEGQERNRIIAITYFIFFLLHVLTAISFLNVLPVFWSLHFVHLSIFLVLIFVIIIAGRILPFFTSVAVPNSNPNKVQALENTIQYLGFLFLFIESLLYWTPDIKPLAASFSILFGIANLVRWKMWEPWKSRSIPILWILHLSYFWLVLGFFAYGFSHLEIMQVSSALHIFTTGGIGVFIYGMITRVSLGHTGRPIRASKLIIVGYISINLAVLARVFFPLINLNREGYLLSAIFWILSFALFLMQYTNILIQPRVDFRSEPRN
ncbi:NnrS protein [Leptospira perolatii]|uniref:NnrS protein n=1 Tax=Leptospira perolatii TaxID=2023191 RepID=A0A2M9ZKN2_9LEPT|nr:NnrS family protein [Leptospira perolatii]PJZ68133.1 NnrS protein [Leptospira perolatii]PJZ72551.1 NnrS protein [Leptospira perolatii]